jgi:tetratricopeptide (TPR) repeat protein
MSNSTFDVFISYSHRDAEWVRDWLLPRLEAAGLRVCIDSRDFQIGAPSVVNMENAVEQNRKTLLVMTPAWVESEWTKFESLLSQSEDPSGVRRRTLPLMLEKCEPPKRLGILTYADFTDASQREAQLARVVAAIRDEPASQPPHAGSKAPTQHLVHPYPLQANFTGRVQERGELTTWLADDARPVCALVAMGGMGKSALAWVWVTNDVLGDARPDAAPAIDGVMWWSFYEGESSFARFIDEALRYVGCRPIDAALFPTTYDRAQELRRLLQSKRVLFVLDGFERQLRAYASLDAAYKQDDAADPSRESRSCVDPNAARFIRDIAAGATRAKLLLTTRLNPSDLEDRAGDPLAGALERELKQLPPDDALRFMRAQGVKKGTDAELAAACAAYGYHPLSLRLLSGLIARDTRTPGDIAAAPRHDVHADLIQRQHHVLEQSYNALPKRERALLSRIAAFRNPMDYDALSIFSEVGLFKRSNRKKFDAALNNLQGRGLLQRDLARNRYDLHPIVRRYAYDRLTDKTGVHTCLREYFTNVPTRDKDAVVSIEELTPVIELYHHTVRAGLYHEAFMVCRQRLNDLLYYRFGAYQTLIELLNVLVIGEEGRSPQLNDKHALGWTQVALANAYSLSGQQRRATPLYNQRIASLEEEVGSANLVNALEAVAQVVYLPLGELSDAERNLRLGIEMSRKLQDEFHEGIGHQELGRLLIYKGAFDEAIQELETALGLEEWRRNKQGVGVNYAYYALLSSLIGDAPGMMEAAQQASSIAFSLHLVRDHIRAEWLLGAALVMEGKNLNDASEHLTDALTRCRRINMVDHEPDILLTWALWHRARGDTVEAHARAEEALAIADRCEFRLKQAEIRNFLARVALEAGERRVAREHAEVARERAWCDGPPHCYRVALDEAEALLGELGAGEEK